MEDKDSKWGDIIGTILVLAIIGSVICGILECFSVNTGIVGIVCCLLLALPIPLGLLWFICCKIISLVHPEMSDDSVHKWGIGAVIFLIINFLWVVACSN